MPHTKDGLHVIQEVKTAPKEVMLDFTENLSVGHPMKIAIFLTTVIQEA